MFETSNSSSLDTSVNKDSSDSESNSFLLNCSSSASFSTDSSSSSSSTVKSISTCAPKSALLRSSSLTLPSTVSYFLTFHTIFIHILSKVIVEAMPPVIIKSSFPSASGQNFTILHHHSTYHSLQFLLLLLPMIQLSPCQRPRHSPESSAKYSR